jgi:hypothetical protein
MPASTRWIVEYPEGGWAVAKEDRQRVSDVLNTQAHAIDRGHEIVRNLGGGELIARVATARSATRSPWRPGTTTRTSPADRTVPAAVRSSAAGRGSPGRSDQSAQSGAPVSSCLDRETARVADSHLARSRPSR